MTRESRSDLRLLARLLREARPAWKHLAGLFAMGLLATPLALLVPLPLAIVVDSVLGDAPLAGWCSALMPDGVEASKSSLLLVMALIIVGIAFLNRVQGLGSWMYETWIGERLVLRFRARLFQHLQRLSLAFHDSSGSADAVYRVQYDAHSIQNVAIGGLLPFVGSLIKLTAMIWVTAAIDLELAVVAMVISPVLFALTHFYRGRLRTRWKEVKELESSAMAVVQETLAAVRVVKAFGQEKREEDRYRKHAGASVSAQLRVIFAEAGYSLLVGLTMAGGTAAVLFLGANHVRAGTLSLGDLLLVMGYLAQLYEPLRTIGRKVATLQKAFASADRAFALLDTAPEVADRPDARRLARAHGAVSFRNVGFAYRDGLPILRGISFSAEPGARVGIAGRSGAGKTTLINLLARFYDPTEGSILLDGVDIREIRLADLREQFSLVLQEPVLFSTTIEENIAYGRPEASRAQIEAAARAANAHDFIGEFPEGYATEVGERGMRLSGGERQRISIARAFLKDAPVLLLDEPTSSVDVATESVILEALERLMEGRTTFLIAHRSSTLEGCDLRLYVGDGTAEVRRAPPPAAPLIGGSRK
ncbi:MAG TPA: ABC transporter ATP-binding protein [Planctomycetota bacterium]